MATSTGEKVAGRRRAKGAKAAAADGATTGDPSARRTVEVRRGKAKGCAFETDVLPLLEMSSEEFLSKARAEARILFARTGEVTIDDVRAVCPPPPKVDPRVMGAVFNKSDWEMLHYVKSARKTCHNRPIAVFALRA